MPCQLDAGAIGMIRRQQVTTLKGTATLKGTMVHHPQVALVLALSALLGRSSNYCQLEKTPANQAIKSRNTRRVIFLALSLHTSCAYPENPMYLSRIPQSAKV